MGNVEVGPLMLSHDSVRAPRPSWLTAVPGGAEPLRNFAVCFVARRVMLQPGRERARPTGRVEVAKQTLSLRVVAL